MINKRLLELLIQDEIKFIETALLEEGFKGEELANEFNRRIQKVFEEIRKIIDHYERDFIG
jgi:hypothetical protein